MPQSLHAELAEAADREQVSLNQFITLALASAVGWRRPSRTGVVEANAEPSAPPLDPSGDSDPAPQHSTRLLSLALTVNAVLVAIAAVLAIGLLIAAWS
jgi:hypothetical protein